MNHPPLDVRWATPMSAPAPSTRVAFTMTRVQAAVGALVVVLGLYLVWRSLLHGGPGTTALAVSFVLLGAGNIWLGVAGRRRTGALLAAGREAQLAFRITAGSVDFGDDEAVGADSWPREHVTARLQQADGRRWLVLACPGREERHYDPAELSLTPSQLRALVDGSSAAPRTAG